MPDPAPDPAADLAPDPTRAPRDDLERLVERWFFEAFNGSPVARSTEVWNHVHAAKEELKRRLAAFAAQPAASPLD